MEPVFSWGEITLLILTTIFLLIVVGGGVYTIFVYIRRVLKHKRREKFLRDYQEQKFNDERLRRKR